MPDDTSGNYTKPDGTTAVDGQVAMASQHNLFANDASAALSRRLFADGRKPWTGNQNANGFKVTGADRGSDPGDYVTVAQLGDAIAAVSGLFPGLMVPDTVTTTSAPAGWLYANGQEVSRSTYANLWARVQGGNNLAASQAAKTVGQYGPGDGATTFTLPNLYADGGYFIRPISSGRGIGTVQADELKSHAHTGTALTAGDHQHGGYYGSQQQGTYAGGGTQIAGFNNVTNVAGSHSHALQINTTGGTETRPKNVAYPVLIKT